MTLPQKFINGQLYHFCDSGLKCRAEMLCGEIVPVEVHGVHALILTLNPEDAPSILREEMIRCGMLQEYVD